MNKIAVNIGESFLGETSANNQSVGELLRTGLNLAFVVAGVFILFFLVIAGFKMIQGAGSGNAQDAEKAKQALTSAAVGFVIIFASYWIIKLIEIITGSTFITNPVF